ncbi:MAG TPA: hypothetical protein PKW80_06570 [Bacteroidales bacterium]|nr:hypothetical protein [Bacteroidales bacterium]
MKKSLIILALMFSCFIATYAQNNESEVATHEFCVLMKDKYDYDVATIQDFNINKGNSVHFLKTFYSGYNYAIVAFPLEKGVIDMDLYLYDNDGYKLAESASEDNIEMIEYTPFTSRDMKITLKNYNSISATYSYDFKIIVFYRDNSVVDLH